MRGVRQLARRAGGLALVCAAMLSAGCDDGRGELQAWMDATRASTPRVTEKIAEPKRFEPFRYEATEEVDPFSNLRLKAASNPLARRSTFTAPDGTRPREALEAFPMDSLKLVGNLRQGKVNVALVQVDTAVYQVREGNYVGPNHGRVMRISEDEVSIREIVQDAAGDWVERLTALQLQPAAQEKKQ